MADNVNIIVQDTINDIVVNAAVVVETIDINVQAAVDVVDIVANPNNYVVNINRIIGEQVQSDWTQTDNQAPDYIKNKPTIPAAQVNSDWNATSGVAEILNKPTIPAAVTKTSDLVNDGENGVDPFITAADVPASVTSVGLTMPSAFSVANSPITSSGTLEVTGAGVVSQYVRGDGSLANFPTSTGGGASLSFYLNGSVSQGTIGGVAFREMDRTPILGAGTDFTINANGYIQSFITDANVPNLLEIPAGNWNFETYFSASSGGGNPSFYVELYKWNGTTLSLIASNSATPEGITNGTAIDAYFSALAVPQTTLLATDRLAVRIYVTHSGRTITLHTENSHLCQVITTFSTGLTALNGLTTQVQSFATGTSGTDFGISSATSTHTFNLPTASAANRGALSSTDWTTFNGKFTLPALTSGSVLFSNGTTIAQDNTNLFWDDTNNRLGIGTNAPAYGLDVNGTARVSGNTAINSGSEFFSLGQVGRKPFRLFTSNGDKGCLRLERDGTINVNLSSDSAQFGASYISNTNFLVGTTTDAGFKLDVNGTARVSGTTTITPAALTGTAATSALDIAQTWNTTGTPTAIKLNITDTASNGNSRLLDIQAGGVSKLIFGKNGKLFFGAFNSSSNIQGNDTSKGLIFSTSLNSVIGHGFEFANLQGSIINLSSTSNGLLIQAAGGLGFSPTSGTGLYNSIHINDKINQTGGANGITRGLFINPTLTAAADFRAIEVANGITILGASTTAKASLRIPSGTAPTTPTNGDIWFDGTDLKMRIGGVTKTFTLL